MERIERGGSRWRVFAWGGAALLWLAPLVAMQFTDEVKWTGLDFAVFGAMLVAALGALELLLRNARDRASRLAVAVAVLLGFFLVWAQAAVGLVGRGKPPAALAFAALVLAAIAGALAFRFRPRR
ncbi:MAG TPA: hypothetical protein VFM45_11825 [Anaeromyxobacteraceae bacterium]|nr:hypothetical protein [Anaeromyxobacteraceae bacterium]